MILGVNKIMELEVYISKDWVYLSLFIFFLLMILYVRMVDKINYMYIYIKFEKNLIDV